MVLRMPSPTLIGNTYYVRVRVPADLRQHYRRPEIKRSLGTSDAAAAKALFAEAYADLQLEWRGLRSDAVRLTDRQITALAGLRYKDWIGRWGDDPGDAGRFAHIRELSEGVGGRVERLETWYGHAADRLLTAEGIKTDLDSRTRLLHQFHRSDLQAVAQLERQADGDYRPDPMGDRFPELVRPEPVEVCPPKESAQITLTKLFELWKRDHLANGKPPRTPGDFLQKINDLIAFLGHEDAKAVTPKNISDWCDHLRHNRQPKLSARTVNDKYLAAVRAVYRLAIAKIVISIDPTAPVKVTVPKVRTTRSKGFTDSEANRILTSALADPETLGKLSERTKFACKWVPWICAYTGARSGEIAQLRREDLVVDNDIDCLCITPEAGTVKTNAYRQVPIHPRLVELGLLDFIKSRPTGPLFYLPRKSTPQIISSQAAGVRGKVGEWVREVAGVTDPAIQPNHAWRHRFKTVAKEADIAIAYMDKIQGHSDGKASSDYGETTMKVLYGVVAQL